MSDYQISILFNGYSTQLETGLQANCTCTLLKSPTNNIIIDTRTPWDGDDILKALQEQNITTDQINYVICTHGHSDHVGCNYLFKNAKHIVGKNCISKGDMYYDYELPFKIEENVRIISTPGHTSECISVLVQRPNGIVAITGDLFEKQEDLKDDQLWKCCSEFPDIQETSRQKILEIAKFIVPGHGPMFENEKNSKKYDVNDIV